MQSYHTSVLVKEVLAYLAVKDGRKYIDATLGGGGHTEAILTLGGRVLGLDVDEEALQYVQRKFRPQDDQPVAEKSKNEKVKIGQDVTLARGNFRDIDRIAGENGFREVSGIVFDLGVSSHQLDTAERGFSFQKAGPLDMRMDRRLHVKASDLINGLTKQELAELFYKLGEEYRSREVAQAIVAAREKKPIKTTEELEKIVRHALGGRFSRGGRETSLHPATKVFQALRIVVNDELHSLEEALPKAVRLLEDRGRLVVISFHSLEDRLVKNTFKAFANEGLGTILTEKPITASVQERAENIRSRSAKLRVFERNL